MTTYICKCGQRVQKSISADNTGNRLEGYGPGHECYGCHYAMPWGGNKWDEAAKRFVQDIKGYECRTSRTLSYDSHFIGSTKDKCTCSVVSLDFDFLEQISAWVKDTFPLGELTGGFSRDKIRPTDYSHNGRYCCTFVCASNKKGIAAKAALFARFFDPDGSRKDMTPQQEMEKILANIRKAIQVKEELECATMDSAAPSENADASFVTGGAHLTTGTSLMTKPAHSAQQEKPLDFLPENTIPEFDYTGLSDQTIENLHFAEDEYRHGKLMAERGLVHMGNAIAAAHDELCDTVVAQCDNGRFAKKEDTFRAWCLSIGITKDSAYRLLQVSALMNGSSPRQREILEALPPTLLYAVAKPSAPPELVEKVKNGEVTTNKAYQDLLKENQQLRTDRVNAMNQADRERARADRAESERDKARADQLSTAKDCNRLGLKASQEKDRADKAETRAQEAEKQLEGSRQVAEAANRRADKWKAEAEAARKQPIVGIVDKDEVARQVDALTAEAKAQARSQVKDAQRRANEAEAKYQKLQQDADGFLAPEQACEQQARFIADSMRSMYLNWFGQACATGTPLAQMGAPLYALCGEIMSSLEDDTTINPTAAGSVEDAEREALFE